VTRITKAAPHEFQLDRHIQILCLYDGTIVSVETDNAIFGFPSRELKGMNVCELLDVFTEWKVRSGGTNMNLLLLALLDKENEMPGAAWRVKLNPPEVRGEGATAWL
jgi:hypothetical protein